MKPVNLFEQYINTKKMEWIDDPELGWFMETDPVRLYYGSLEGKIRNILKDGIYADDSGYIKCALDPYTANYHVKSLMEAKNDKSVVFVIDIPASYSRKNPFYVESERITNKNLYESWGKSDVEFYALADIEIPKYIPTKFIKGYMIKNDS